MTTNINAKAPNPAVQGVNQSRSYHGGTSASQAFSGPYFVKVKETGDKRWRFLSRNGTTRLRVHALRFDHPVKARDLIAANEADNPGWLWKVTE